MHSYPRPSKTPIACCFISICSEFDFLLLHFKVKVSQSAAQGQCRTANMFPRSPISPDINLRSSRRSACSPTVINVDISTPCDIQKTSICMKRQPHFLPRELYYRRIFQTLSNVPNIYFDNSIRWLPGFNGSNLRVLRHAPKAQTIMARRIKEEGMNKISPKSS